MKEEFANYPTAMVEGLIFKEQYLVVKEIVRELFTAALIAATMLFYLVTELRFG